MTNAEIKSIKSMSIESRMQLMNELWTSICEDEAAGKEVPSPDWHREVLEERQKRIDSGETKFISFDELKKRLGRESK